MDGDSQGNSTASKPEYASILFHIAHCEGCYSATKRGYQAEGGIESVRKWLRSSGSNG